MKMMRTRLLSFALAVMMVLSMLPGTALAQGSFSYTVDGTTTYTATLEEAITAANGYLAKGKNVVVDLFADAIDLAEGVIVTSRGKTATLTVNMNGHKMESTQRVFRIGYGTKETNSNITLVINGGDGSDGTRGTIVFGGGTGEVNQNGIECYGASTTITLNYVDCSRGMDSTTNTSNVRSCIMLSSYTNGSTATLNLNDSTVTDLNTNTGGNNVPIMVSPSSTGTEFSTVINLSNSVLTSQSLYGAIRSRSDNIHTRVNVSDSTTLINHVTENQIGTANVFVHRPDNWGRNCVAVDGGWQTNFIPSVLTEEQIQESIVQTALAYYYHNPYIQYDGHELTNDNTIERHVDWASPEDAAEDMQVYSMCSNFPYKCYYDAFDYKIVAPSTTRWVTLSQNHPVVVCQYVGGETVTDIDTFLAETRTLLKPGDIIVGHNGNSDGHAMLYVGDCMKNGTDYILHCAGKSFDLETGEEKPEASGSIRLDEMDTYCMNYLSKHYTLGIVVVRPYLDWLFPVTVSSNGIGRLTYPNLKITRELDRTRFSGVCVGEEVPVTVTVENKGSTLLTGIPVEEYLPEGQTLVADSATAGVQIDGNTLRWSVDVAEGESVSLTYKVKISGNLGETVTFPHGRVGGIRTRETTLRISGSPLTAQQGNTLYSYGTGIVSGSFQDLNFFNSIYRDALGLEIYLPSTTQELLTKLTTVGEDGNLYRKDTVAAEDQGLDMMILPLHFTGRQVVNDGSTWSRVANYNQVFYQPGDLFIALKGSNVTSVTDSADLELMVYLGNGEVLKHTTDSVAKVEAFDTAFLYALGFNVLIALRPTQADEIGITGEGPFNVTVTPAVNGTLTAVPVGQVNSGKRVTVTAVPEDGYVLEQLTVNGTPVAVDSNGQYFFHADETAVVAAEFIPAVIKVAGYTSDDGVETLFTVDLRLTEDDVENHAYTTVEKAFAAAVYAWHGTETGTIDLYRDVEITETTKYNPSAVDNGVFYPLAGGQDSLKLNLHGNTIKSGDSLGNAYLFYPHSSTTLKLVINGKDDTSGNGTIVWDTMRAMIYTRTKASNDITINHTNVERTKANKNVSNGHLMALNANGGLITINGGVWKLGRVNDYDVAISLATGDALSTTEGEKEVSFHLTGGVEIYATAQRIIRIGNNGKVYVDDAQIHTAATEEQVAGYGYGIASITDGTNGATTASDLYTTEGFVVLGSPDGTVTSNMIVGETTEFSGVSVRTLSVLPYCDINAEETVNGSITVSHGGEALRGTEVTVTVDPDEWYELAGLTINGKTVEVTNNTCTFTVAEDTVIAATFEKVESVKVAGYTADGAAEIVYYYNRAISADDEANRTYTSVEKAFIAAKNDWNASGTGTVDIYTDVVLETVAAYDAYGVFNSPTDCDTVLLTLNLHGNRITAGKDIPGFLVRIEKTAATRDITINGKDADGEKNGLLAWDADRGVIYEGFFSGAETNIVLNNVDIIRENGGSRATNSHILAPNSDNVNVTINGGIWELRNGTMAYKIARVGRNNNTFYLTGGAVILSAASDLITADEGRTYEIHVYADDAVLYTAADDTAIDGDGKGIVGVGTPTVQWGSPDGTVTSNMTVGETTEFDGVVVRPLTVEPYVAPIVQPTLTLKAPTLEFKDMICVVAFYTAENIDDVVEMGMITYTEKVDTVSVETAAHVIPGANYDEGSGRYYSSSQGIHAKYLADTVYLACYAKLSDGSYVYTKLAPYSPITYATNQLKNSTDTSLKQLVAAMLNYGAEAQLYFGHNTENLANAGMTEEQLTLPETYREDMVSAVPAASAEKQGSFANNYSGFSSRKPAISFEGAFCINYFFTPAYAPVDGITLYYWNETDFNDADVLTEDNASGSLKLEGSGTGQYRGDIVGISAKNLSQAVYVAAVYSDGTTTWTSGVLGYSIGAYCGSLSSKGGDVAALAMATAVYGYHAKQYFG